VSARRNDTNIAFRPSPSITASASTTSGTARAVLRKARPALELLAKALKIAPRGVGWAYGDGPTAMIIPAISRTTKNRRWRHRKMPAARRLATTSP
jgi:hypothetical protein